jgi:hypothetical protein
MPDHNPQRPRRPHYHRGRRGPDSRGQERRPAPPQQEAPGRDHLDIEQLMREIRSRISERHGIDFSPQQIQELAARRLEAILDPRAIKPSLIDELRRAAGLPVEATPEEPEIGPGFDASSFYDSSNGFVRLVRRLLRPLLKLFFEPDAVIAALGAQARLNKAAAARNAEQQRRQTEWNGLHYEILRRLVTDIARTGIDAQHLALRVESLAGKVDFNERQVRGLEQTLLQSKSAARSPEIPALPPAATPAREGAPLQERRPPDGSPDAQGQRRRRRRRRGRRSGGGPPSLDVQGGPAVGAGGFTHDGGSEAHESADEDMGGEPAGADVEHEQAAAPDSGFDEPPAEAPRTESPQHSTPADEPTGPDVVPPER